MNQHFSR